MFPPSMRSAFGVSPQTSVPSGQGQSDLVGDFINRVLPALRSDRAQRMNDELAAKIKEMNYMRTGGRLPLPGTPEIGQQSNTSGPQMNTVMAQGQINPLDAAKLALQKAAEEGKNTRAQESIAGRESIASQAEQGRSSRATLRSDTAKSISDNKIQLGMKQLGLKSDQFDFYKQLRDMTDSEKLQAVQDGKITMEHLKNLDTMGQIDERGSQNINAINARGAQQRKTAGSKPMTPQQQAVDYENKARELLSSHPEYKGYINFNKDTGKLTGITNAGDDNIFHSINQSIYGNKEPGDINLPADTQKPQSSNETYTGGGSVGAPEDDTLPKTVTQYQKGDDPLGILGDVSGGDSDNA